MADVTIHQRRQTLDKMTNGFGLDDAYGTTLDRIREQKGNAVKLGMEALIIESHRRSLHSRTSFRCTFPIMLVCLY